MRNEVTVVGAGVSGLTCAVRLLEAGYGVRVVAAELAADARAEHPRGDGIPGICSPWAAAVWYPYAIQPREKVAQWGLESLRAYQALQDMAGSGVSLVTVTLLYGADPGPAEWSLLEGCDHERIPRGELRPGYEAGVRMRVPFIDTSVFLPFLEDRIRALGGTVQRCVPLLSMEEMRALGPVVVNCTGLGARDLCGDTNLRPGRGQVLRVRAPGVERYTIAVPAEGHGRPVYVIPRSGDCVLGGTNEADVWDEWTDPETVASIQEACRALEPALADEPYEIVCAAAGLRPVRDKGVRLDAQVFDDGGAVIHDYGHGGAGYTVAWGCADEVAKLAGEQFARLADASTRSTPRRSMPPDLFISYAREDRDRVLPIVTALERNGYTVWSNTDLPVGEDYILSGELLQAVGCVVVVWSQHSVKSSALIDEANVARRRGVLLPVYIDMGIQLPPSSWGILMFNLSSWGGNPSDWAFEQFTRGVADVLASGGNPVPPRFTPAGPAASGAKDWKEDHESRERGVAPAPPPTLTASAPKSRRNGVFISYSRKDIEWLQRLQTHLRPLEREGVVVWDDTRLRPGEPWREEIRKAMAATKVAILLVSADFLASDFITTNELPPLLKAAEEDGATILPVIISPSGFKRMESLSRFQTVNDPEKPLVQLRRSNRERVLDQVAGAVADALRR